MSQRGEVGLHRVMRYRSLQEYFIVTSLEVILHSMQEMLLCKGNMVLSSLIGMHHAGW